MKRVVYLPTSLLLHRSRLVSGTGFNKRLRERGLRDLKRYHLQTASLTREERDPFQDRGVHVARGEPKTRRFGPMERDHDPIIASAILALSFVGGATSVMAVSTITTAAPTAPRTSTRSWTSRAAAAATKRSKLHCVCGRLGILPGRLSMTNDAHLPSRPVAIRGTPRQREGRLFPEPVRGCPAGADS